YPDGRSGDYAFKHALVRDALYQSLLTAPRTALHLNIAEEIERRSGNRLAEVAETLAHHYGQTDRDEKAFEYLAMAGAKSLGVYSLEEAEAHFGAALALIDKLPECATDQQVAAFLVDYLMLVTLLAQFGKVVATVGNYAARLERSGDSAAVLLILHQKVMSLIYMGRFADAQETQERVSRLADQLHDDRSIAYALVGQLHISTVFAPKSIEEFQVLANQAMAAAKRTNDAYIQSWLQWTIAWDAVHRGLIATAAELADNMRSIGA